MDGTISPVMRDTPLGVPGTHSDAISPVFIARQRCDTGAKIGVGSARDGEQGRFSLAQGLPTRRTGRE